AHPHRRRRTAPRKRLRAPRPPRARPEHPMTSKRPAKSPKTTKASKTTKAAKAARTIKPARSARAARAATPARPARKPAAKAAPRARALPFEVDATANQPLGMSPQAFLRDYWHKRPLLVRNAFPAFHTPVMPPDVAALLEHFRFLPRWRIDDIMISFAATGGSVGAHVDHYDVFLLQAHGHRRWMIDASVAMGRPAPDLSFREDVAIKLLRQFNP